MAVSCVLQNAIRDVLGDALNDYLDGGVLEILQDSTVLATFALPAKASNTSTNGVITFGAIAATTGSADGVANVCKLWTSGKGALAITGNVGTSGCLVNLSSTTISTGKDVEVNSASLTVPSGA